MKFQKKFAWSMSFISFSCLVSCSSQQINTTRHPAQEAVAPADGEFVLKGFNETLLVGDQSGTLAVVKVGTQFHSTLIKTSMDSAPVSVRSHGSKFYALYDSGHLLNVDTDSGQVEDIDLRVKDSADFEFASENEIYVSLRKSAKVVKVTLKSSEPPKVSLALKPPILSATAVGLSRSATGRTARIKSEAHRMVLVGNQLFVQVSRANLKEEQVQGALAVINVANGTFVQPKWIEMKGKDSTAQNETPGLNPDLPMAADEKHSKLFVTLIGQRPRDTGAIVAVDLKTLTVSDFKRADAGFQGIFQLGTPFNKAYVIFHTSTPQISSHLFSYKIDKSGKLTELRNGTLVDAFDGLDALSINNAGTLVAMANTCQGGFCALIGEGLNFVDALTETVLHKLKAEQIGLAPRFVYFK